MLNRYSKARTGGSRQLRWSALAVYFERHATRLCIFATLLFLASISVVYPLFSFEVWPHNHEHITFLQRTRVYSQRLAIGDLIPVWSSMDNLSLGSPFPALYHKLFYLVSGSLNALGLNAINAVKLSLILFLWLGSIGMYFLMRRTGCTRLTAAAGATYFIFANYVVTNWLIRGAMAELSATALVPWLIWSFFVSLDQQRVTKRLGLVLALLFLAHSVMAFFSILVLFIAGVFAVLIGRLSLSWRMIARSGPAAALCSIIVLPYATVMLLYRSAYDMSRLTFERFHPANHFRSLADYFWDAEWRWGESVVDLTTQLDLPLIALSLVALVLFLLRRTVPRGRRAQDLLIILSLFVLCFGLQMEWSLGFYELVPGALFLQFPWRLLAFMSPALIVLAMGAADLASRIIGPWLAIGTCIAGILVSGVFQPIRYDYYLGVPDSMILGDFNVYMPVRAQHNDLRALLDSVHRQACTIGPYQDGRDATVESRIRRLVVSCPVSGRVALPVFAAAGMELQVGPERSTRSCAELDGFAGLCAVDTGAGNSVVTVRFPTFWSLVGDKLSSDGRL